MTKTAPLSFPDSFFVFFLSHSHFFHSTSLSSSNAFCKCHSFFTRVRKTLIWTIRNKTQICCSHLLFQEKYTSQKEEKQQWPDLENDSVFYKATYVQNYHMEFPPLHKSGHTQICCTLYFKSAKFLRGSYHHQAQLFSWILHCLVSFDIPLHIIIVENMRSVD